MNIPEYIASGILESYALGTVTDQERREVQCLSSIYPEVRKELDELTNAMESYALALSTEPPAGLKDQIWQKIQANTDEAAKQATEKETIVRPMPVLTGTYTYKFTWLVAASVGFAVLFFSYFLFSQLRQNQETTTALRSANNLLQGEVHQLRDQQLKEQQLLTLLRLPGTRTIELKGNEKAPSGDMLVYWNAASKQVTVEARAMPPLPADKQYQLWSMVDGKPVDAGVFETDTAPQTLNRAIARADAFAVTIEKRGGSSIPTLTNLVMLTAVGT